MVDEILPPGQGMVRVSALPRLFERRGYLMELPAGSTIAEMVAVAVPDDAMRRWVGVRIDGDVILPEHWHRIRPKPGRLVEIVAGGGDSGGDGGKDPLRTVLMIAVIAASIYVGGLGLGTLNILGSEISIASIAAGATLALGGMLVNAIAPPSKPKLPEISGAGAQRDSPTYDIAGARNTAQPFGVVPRVLGEHRVVPPYGARPYTEIVGDDEYLRMLFVWSIGPVEVEDRVIGETDVDSFEEVEREFRRGYQADQLTDQGNWDASTGAYPAAPSFGDTYTVSVAGTADGVDYAVGDTIVFNGLVAAASSAAWDRNGDQALTLFSNSVFQEDLAVALTQAAGGQVRTSQAQADELSVDITFSQGLVSFDNQGNKSSRTVEVKVEYSPAGAGTWSDAPGLAGGVLTVTANRTSAVRAGHRWTVDQGQYDVRLTRLTADTNSSQIADACSWSALRTIKSVYPIDCEVALAVEAVRIKATGQLRGIIDQFKGKVTSILPEYDSGSGAWVHAKTRSPAACYRAVLQDAGQARPVADAGVAVADLEDWHGKSQTRGYSFDAVIDFATSGRELLQDIASAGSAGCARPGGAWSVAIDESKAVVQHFSPRNSWGFSGSKNFVDLPHALRCRFSNRERSYRQDERMVYRDGYGPANATEFEGFEQFGVTDPAQIWRRGREHLASAVLRPERYSLFTDPAWLVANRGSVIRVQHDVLLVGLGSGRIKTVLDDGGGNCTGFVVDEVLDMEAAKSYVLRVQHVLAGGAVESQLLPIDTDTGGVTTVTLTTPVALVDAPDEDDLFLFGESGLESIEGMVLNIRPRDDLSAQILFVDAAPEIEEAAAASRDFPDADVDAVTDTITVADHPFYDGDVGQVSTTGALPTPLQALTDYYVVNRADGSFQLSATDPNASGGGTPIDLTDAGTGTHTFTRRIPDFTSSITSASSLGAPEVTNARSDGTVLFREPDGSWTSRVLLTLKRPSGLQTDVTAVQARFRPSGSAGTWSSVSAERDAGEISLMPVEDGLTYAYQLRWAKTDGTFGDWTAEATHAVVGKTAPPNDVTGFSAQQNGNVVTFRWSQVPDLDRNGYEIRYMLAPFIWEDATSVTKETRGTLVTNAALPPGTWVLGIKAVDTSGNLSANATTATITVTNENDVVAVRTAHPRWAGTRSGYVKHDVSGKLVPDSNTLAKDMSDAELWDRMTHDPVLNPTYEAQAIDLGFDADGVRVWADIAAELGPGESGAATAGLQIDTRDDAGSFDGFEAWTIGTADFRHLKARIRGDNANGAAAISEFTVTADVQERAEGAQDVAVGVGGASIAFATPFHATPDVEARAEPVAGAARHALITNIGTTGFDVAIVDRTDTDTGGTLDYWKATGP